MTSYRVSDLRKETSQSQELLQTDATVEEAPRTATIYEVLKQCCLAHHRNTEKCSHCQNGFEIRRMYELLGEELPRWKNDEKYEALAYWQNKGRIILKSGRAKYWHFDFFEHADPRTPCSSIIQKKREAARDRDTVSQDHSPPVAMIPPSVSARYLLDCVLDRIRQDKKTLVRSVVEHNLHIVEIEKRFADVINSKDKAELFRCKIL